MVKIGEMIQFQKSSRLIRGIKVLWTLISFALYVYFDFRAKKNESFEGRDAKLRRQAARLRERLIGLGPTFIKMGQMLATRADMLPIEYLDELSALQDKVPPFSNEQAFDLIESELGRPIKEIFSQMSEQPIASASLGQVYRATLMTGEEVAVKVQRPQLADRVAMDLDLLRWMGGKLERYPRLFPGTDWLAAIDEFDRMIHEEMDYRREAENAKRFRNNFRDWPDVFVPRVFENLSSGRVLVLEYVSGAKVTDLDRLRAEGQNPRRINELLYRTYFKQLFEDGFFHADPHPGNLRVTGDGKLAFLDFGMVGRLSEELQRQIVDAFFHLFNRDVDRIVDDLIGLGFLAPEADLAHFRAIVAEVFKRKLNLKLGEVKFRELTYDLAPVIYEHAFTTPARFTYLIRALMTMEGISIAMNPDFNFFEVARPYARDFLFRRESARLRKMALDSLRDARTGRFEWDRLWAMVKMAYSLYFDKA